jgi:hypothetical protein
MSQKLGHIAMKELDLSKLPEKFNNAKREVFGRVNDLVDRIEDNEAFQTLAKPIEQVKDVAKAQAKKAEGILRSRFGGYDTSQTEEAKRAKRLEQYKNLFEIMDIRGRQVHSLNRLRVSGLGLRLFNNGVVFGLQRECSNRRC